MRSGIPKLYALPCGHDVLLSIEPAEGDWFWCCRCDKNVQLKDVKGETKQWRIKCESCGHGRKFNQARCDAERAARRHALNHPAHDVEVLYGNNPVIKINVVYEEKLLELP